MTLIMGLVWGTAYLLCGRNIWVVILAHSGGHVLLVTRLYFAAPFILSKAAALARPAPGAPVMPGIKIGFLKLRYAPQPAATNNGFSIRGY